MQFRAYFLFQWKLWNESIKERSWRTCNQEMSVEDCALWSLPWTLSRLSNGGKQPLSSIMLYPRSNINTKELYAGVHYHFWSLPLHLLLPITSTIIKTTITINQYCYHYCYHCHLPLLITITTITYPPPVLLRCLFICPGCNRWPVLSQY